MKKLLPFILYISLLFTGALTQRVSAQTIDFGKSYVNVTKGLGGGTVETGDVLEIRASFVIRAGLADSCSFSDIIPAGTSYIPGTIAVITNEGKIYKSFTDAMGDDEGWISGTNVRINLGYNQLDQPATASRRGRLRNTHKPSIFGASCIMVASYRVVVTGSLGSVINVGGGFMTYKPGAAPITSYTYPNNPLLVYTNIGLCPNIVGVNTLGTEFNGSFGSGKPRNRAASANVPPSYTYKIFDVNTPNDYSYGIANNTSTRPNYTTLDTWAKPDLSATTHRVFQVWDIIGDHTGAAVPALGNPAADTVNNNNGGYMLVVNASYRIDSAFQHTISGLCPDTYYEISCWIRNICSKCGCDTNGKGASTAGYIPSGPGDSSGINPNITFELDGIDYYSTGNIQYSGTWVKKGFTFKTGPAQSSFTLKFFNNAPGGGGNDWALDDIAVATCYPNLSVTPSTFSGCAGNPVSFGATVSSYFDNYDYYKWQKSTDGGFTWFDAGVSGIATPVLVGWQYQYTANYPPFIGLPSDSGTQFRIVVATTAGNLSSAGCSYMNMSAVTNIQLFNCSILPLTLIDFRGWAAGKHNELDWSTENELSPVTYVIEKSTNGTVFHDIGSINAEPAPSGKGSHHFTDPETASGTAYYRIRIVEDARSSYGKTIVVNRNGLSDWAIRKVVNPFSNGIQLQAILPYAGTMNFILRDAFGRTVLIRSGKYEKGQSDILIPVPAALTKGIYILTVQYENSSVNLKLVRQ